MGCANNLQRSFNSIQVLNLHGSGNVNFLGTRGAEDENVFDILQGVGIGLFSKRFESNRVIYSELIGNRKYKYDCLIENRHIKAEPLTPSSPYFLWIPRTQVDGADSGELVSLTELFGFYNVSGKPGDDNLLVSFDRDEVLPKLQNFRQRLASNNKPKLTEAGRNLAAQSRNTRFDPKCVIRYAYRPFDTRFTYYDPDIWTRAVRPLKACVDGTPILLTTKIVKDPHFSHVFVTREFADVIFLSATSSVNCFSFPMHLAATGERAGMKGLQHSSNLRTEKVSATLTADVKDEEVFAYCYAVLHSPNYRQKYFEALQYDFPRLPLTGNLELFRALARLGGELVTLHLLESPKLDKPRTEFIGARNPEVEKVAYSKNTVWIDKAKTTGFKDVPEDVWNFHIGGYQVCEKWLKDRKGRALSKDDIAH